MYRSMLNEMHNSFRNDLTSLMNAEGSSTKKVRHAIHSKEDGVLAKAIGQSGIEIFANTMSSEEFLGIFAPNLLTYFKRTNTSYPLYNSLDDLLLDIEIFTPSMDDFDP